MENYATLKPKKKTMHTQTKQNQPLSLKTKKKQKYPLNRLPVHLRRWYDSDNSFSVYVFVVVLFSRLFVHSFNFETIHSYYLAKYPYSFIHTPAPTHRMKKHQEKHECGKFGSQCMMSLKFQFDNKLNVMCVDNSIFICFQTIFMNLNYF